VTRSGTRGLQGSFVRLDGETYYRIARSQRMAPFLMSIASDTDLWMFIASSGGLTAGRVDPDGALFPYENVDRLYDSHLHTGPITLIRVRARDGDLLWQPFAAEPPGAFRIERRLYKNIAGNRVVFEEINRDLGLAFRQRWSGCEAFGWVRTARLQRIAPGTVRIEVLDGLRNVLAFGAPLALYQQQSSLVEAYRCSELDPSTGLAIFSLTARITDRAEAAESLRANTVWCTGLARPVLSLGDDAIAAFRAGRAATPRGVITGRRAHFLASASLELQADTAAVWHVAADAGRGPLEIAALREQLRAGAVAPAAIERELDEAAAGLVRRVAAADGLQCTAHPTGPAHHFANVLFNVMRGGVFADGYHAPRTDVVDFLHTRRKAVAARHAARLEALPERVDVPALIEAACASGDPDFERLALEYLPLCFGRRHGDPSRPWNRFSIRLRDEHGAPQLYYEGNWRDVFQNWEALAASFPRYLPGMIAKFVNASTVDGFNPYRITRDGADWEVVDPDDPWGYIGYWGDHQIVYLLRLMEALHRFAPGALRDLLDRPVFSYANVPYRLKPYAAILANPHATVDFDAALDASIAGRVAAIGTDGRLVARADGGVRHACLVEKLLVAALARLSNYVAGGGIWMNTQRPEWNDANNALAGWGVSTVTLCYLRRYLAFLEARIGERGAAPATIDAGVATWAREVRATFEAHPPGAAGDARARRALLDTLGESFERHRARAYAGEDAGATPLGADEINGLCRAALAHVDATLAANRRADGLYHAYHVIGAPADGGLPLVPLTAMLEGQVAALSAGAMTPAAAAALIEAMFESPLYDPVRRSFMLYPEVERPGFLERNAVPAAHVRAIGLLRDLLAENDGSIVALDAAGTGRFHPELAQADVLEARLDALAARAAWEGRVARDRRAVLDLYEEVFRHRSFTGRSGAMYGYEGIGCIYWHMVAKLLLAVQEQARAASRAGDPAAARLIHGYYRIRAGLGFEKTPGEYGAFPTDPYSHTPRHGGASQPGMTGQVKEEILARLGELGIEVEDGRVAFRPWMLDRAEFLAVSRRWRYPGPDGAFREIQVPARALAFTWCGTPIVYRRATGARWIRVIRADGATTQEPGDTLDPSATCALFARNGEIARIVVGVDERALITR